MKLKFNITRVVDDYRRGSADEERYEAGKTYDIPDVSAEHWIRRQVAEVAADEPPLNVAPQDSGKSSDDGDLLKILAGTIDEVRESVDALDASQLARLRNLEKSGKKRNGVYSAIDDALNDLRP